MVVAMTAKTTVACTTGAETGRQLAHHWRIEEPMGAQSLGVCLLCGATRWFANWDSVWDVLTNNEQRALRLIAQGAQG